MEAKPIAKILPGVLTEMLAPATKVTRAITTYPKLGRFGQFQTRNDPELERMYAAAEKFAADVNNTTAYWLCLLGKSGIGKTHIARMLYRHFMGCSRFNLGFDAENQRLTGNTGRFCDWRSLSSDLKQGSYGRIEDLSEDWLVVLDDIGAVHDPSGFISSALDQVVNNRRNKWTVITCNFWLKEIGERMDVRIASRMLRNNGVVIECGANDFNL